MPYVLNRHGEDYVCKMFEQTAVNLIFKIMHGPILLNETDERFKILTSYSFKRELISHFINFH